MVKLLLIMSGPLADPEREDRQQHADQDQNDSYRRSLSDLERFEGGLIIQIEQSAGGAGRAALGQDINLVIGLKCRD